MERWRNRGILRKRSCAPSISQMNRAQSREAERFSNGPVIGVLARSAATTQRLGTLAQPAEVHSATIDCSVLKHAC